MRFDVNLGQTCTSVATAVHEIGHFLGMEHEQKRADRDQHVKINLSNLESKE